MRRLDDVVASAVHPQVEVAERAKRIVGLESGKGDHAEATFAGALGGYHDVRRFAGAADQDRDIATVAVELDGFGHPILVTVVVAEAGDHVSLVEVDRP